MSGQVFRNVALLGATGQLGKKVTTALVKAGYSVTAVQRKESTNPVPEGVKSIKVDLSSISELTSAFQGHDAVVSTVPNPKLSDQKPVIDASVAAGIKRLIPSEFSTNLDNELAKKLPIVKDKVEVRKYLTETINGQSYDGSPGKPGAKLDWTSVNGGPFFDLGINYGFLGPNGRNKTATFHDGGSKTVCTTSLADLAAAVVAVLDPKTNAATANAPVYVRSATITEQQITRIAAKALGISESDFKVKHLSVEQLFKEAEDKSSRGEQPGQWIFNYYMQFMYGEGYGGDWTEIGWNERIGLRVMDEAEMEENIREWYKELTII